MDWFSTLFLGVDGITNGAVYALVGLSLVLVYTTTRVVNVAQGEFLTFGALSFASFMEGSLTSLLYVVLGTGAVCLLLDALQAMRFRRSPLKLVIRYGVCGTILTALAYAACHTSSTVLQMGAALALVATMGPLIYRLTVEPNPGNSPVVLLICSVGVSLILHPLALLLWGADPRTVPPLSDLRFSVANVDIAMQSVIILSAAIVMTAALFLFFRFSLVGKALRAASINRDGALYCGIPVGVVGRLSYFIAAGMSALSGMLLAPLVTANYEMGFVVGLKGFVGATMGGLINYPLSLAGVFLVGVFESFSSFFSSSLRDAWVFSLVIPILLWRSTRLGGELNEH
ncbi:High-affinity branched-chain amino acid transport system permease protein LivH [Paraburkholderia sediminicola]|uniref:High-affinity branched-chain amino acid transport system permease protein LivH n=1 Tax=Paraburkholderia sediminicola TaxID=458836 RepID=A0A6J5CDM4_9BURK|nr:branched-chain amino acid ABC transporter permease [Paraburkholderia sediminicola]CAB3733160.1 High-affinity branched-chain amino acid transport system permease protein LivH [Paraburkholderia sediminicola]